MILKKHVNGDSIKITDFWHIFSDDFVAKIQQTSDTRKGLCYSFSN